jgi:nitrite reductase/ring-hydroxylating ferredoxin subunit
MHGWRFSTANGKHDTGDFCLVTYAVRVTGDQIEVSA